MTTQNIKPIAIFRPGKHTATNGMPIEFTDADVNRMASAYDPTKWKAPLVLGHPKDNAPAYGWTKALAFKDGLLSAMPEAINPEFADWVNQGHYRNVSASLYTPEHPHNPVPGVYYLRHIGFLGGQPPAIKGLPAPEFGDDNNIITLEFTEETAIMAATTETVNTDTNLAQSRQALEAEKAQLARQQAEFAERQNQLKAEQEALQREKQAAAKAEIVSFADGLVKAGRLLPKDKLGLIEFMSSLSTETIIEFGEGETKTRAAMTAWFKSFMSALPKQIEFGELTGQNPTKQSELSDAQIAQKARIYHKKMTESGVSLSFADAVDAVRLELSGE